MRLKGRTDTTLLALLLPVLAPVAFGQTAPASSPPATTTASQSAPTAENAPRAALAAFFRAMLAGDADTALSLLNYSNPQNRAPCESVLREAASRQRAADAAAISFGKEAAESIFQPNEAASLEKSLDTAPVGLRGTTAEVTLKPQLPPFVLIQVDGKWLVQFEKTQDAMGPMPGPAEIAAAKRRAAGYGQLASDIQSKKIKTLQDVRLAAELVLTTPTSTSISIPKQP